MFLQTEQEEKELEKIADRFRLVKKAGFGEVNIKIANGVVVYITHTIGEQLNYEEKVS